MLHVRLHLVTRVIHERSLELPAPMKDARTLRTLLLLDLESHPPPARHHIRRRIQLETALPSRAGE